MGWIDELKKYWTNRNKAFIYNDTSFFIRSTESEVFLRKQNQLQDRKTEIVKAVSKGDLLGIKRIEDRQEVNYMLSHQYLLKQKESFYIEESVEERRAIFLDYRLKEDVGVSQEGKVFDSEKPFVREKSSHIERIHYQYNRLAAVQYAERWWNTYNPAYKSFDVDCTNYISQCLYAGGAPMRGYANRAKGWWYQNKQWSYSWAVAHAFRWYLSGSRAGLIGKELSSADQLMPGDVICYDFDGDGKWQHSTIVVAKDDKNMPLVNAHTTNSRMRYWNYEDSTAWTPKIKYKFFHIIDG